MDAPLTTREKLLFQARMQFWRSGYSNVSVRQIASAAGVDIALISRNFGSKQGLFEASLEGAFELDPPVPTTRDALVDRFVRMFVDAPRESPVPSVLQMLLTNAHDADVGALVQRRFQETVYAWIVSLTGDHLSAGLFVAVVLGMSISEKSLHLPGIAPFDSQDYEAQLRYLMTAALHFDGSQHP